MGCGVWGTGCDQLTAIGHAKVTAVCLMMYYKLTWGKLKLFHLQQGQSKEEGCLGCMRSFAKAGRSYGIRERTPRKVHHCLSHKGYLRPLCKSKVLMLRIVKFLNGLRPSMGYPSYCTNCHVHALFVNGRRLATSSHMHEWAFIVPCFLGQHTCRELQPGEFYRLSRHVRPH